MVQISSERTSLTFLKRIQYDICLSLNPHSSNVFENRLSLIK